MAPPSSDAGGYEEHGYDVGGLELAGPVPGRPLYAGAPDGSDAAGRGLGPEPPPVPAGLAYAALINAEITAVLALMRQNARWAGGGLGEPAGSDPLLADLRGLRRRLWAWRGPRGVRPVVYLAPFLEVIRAPEAPAAITAAALSAVEKMLIYGVVPETGPAAAEAMHAIADAVSHCRYERADADTDDAAALRALGVLRAALRSPAGALLPDDDIRASVQTCYAYATLPGREGDVVVRAARAAAAELIRAVFRRVPELQVEPEPQPEAEGARLPGSPLRGQGASGDMAASTADEAAAVGTPRSSSHAVAGSAGSPVSPPPHEDSLLLNGAVTPAAVRRAGGGAGGAPAPAGGPGGGPNGVDSAHAGMEAVGPPWGLPAVADVWGFLVGLLQGEDGEGASGRSAVAASSSGLASRGPWAEELLLFHLGLVQAALEAAGASLAAQPRLRCVIQDRLCRALLRICVDGGAAAAGAGGAAGGGAGASGPPMPAFPSPPVLAAVASLMLTLYLHARRHLAPQLEAFVGGVLLRLGEGRPVALHGPPPPGALQEAALEALVDLCRVPTLLPDLFANFDCALDAGDLAEELVALLCKAAFPVAGPLAAPHLLGLEGLLAVVHALADRAAGAAAAAEHASRAEEASGCGPGGGYPSDPSAYTNFWDEAGPDPAADVAGWVSWLRRRKHVKRRLKLGVDHFNRDVKKGQAFLQGVHLLPTPLDARGLAQFLRRTPGLAKTLIGDLLGEPDAFSLELLDAFTGGFDLGGLALHSALRLYLESFRLPGEAQKIGRLMEAFAQHYYDQNCPGVFVNKDAAYVLAYSVIMLNTDAHNPQVKKRMTAEDFVRNNRGINNGSDLPRDMLVDLYHDITRHEIRMSTEAAAGGTGPLPAEAYLGRWRELSRRARRSPLVCTDARPLLDRDMLSIVWGPTVAAVSVVFDHAEAEPVLRDAVGGLLAVAKAAARHKLAPVLDHLMQALARVVTGRTPAGPAPPGVSFGEDMKARMAAVTLASVAAKYGDSLRAGWRPLVDVVVRFHTLGMLPPRLLAGLDDAPLLPPRPAPARPAAAPPSAAASAASAVLRSFSSLLALDAAPEAAADREAARAAAEAAAEQRTLRCLEACRLDELLADSKFLPPGALLALCEALVAAAGGGAGGSSAGTAALQQADLGLGGDDEEGDRDERDAAGGSGPNDAAGPRDAAPAAPPPFASGPMSPSAETAALFCTDLLLAVTVRNRDRLPLLWPVVGGHLASVLAAAEVAPPAVLEQALRALLRLAARLVPYKPAVADELLRALSLLPRLDARVAEHYAPLLAEELRGLLRAAGPHIHPAAAWRTLGALLAATAPHPEAAGAGFEALAELMMGAGGGSNTGGLTPENLRPCVAAAGAFVRARAGGVERALQALQLLTEAGAAVGRWAGGDAAGDGAEVTDAGGPDDRLDSDAPTPRGPVLSRDEAVACWLVVVRAAAGAATADPRPEVRGAAVLSLQRVLLLGAAEPLAAGPATWAGVVREILLPLLADHVAMLRARAADWPGAERTLRLAIGAATRAFLAALPALQTLPEFGPLWLQVLHQLAACLRGTRSEEVAEAIPEALKNLLLVLQAQGGLAAPKGPAEVGTEPTPADALWAETWAVVATIAPGLTPDSIAPPGLAPPTA